MLPAALLTVTGNVWFIFALWNVALVLVLLPPAVRHKEAMYIANFWAPEPQLLKACTFVAALRLTPALWTDP